MTNKPPFRGERVRLGDVCKVGSFEPSGDNPTWLLNLDAIEKDTGRILVKQLVDRDSIGTSTVPFNGDCVLYSKLRPNLNKVVLPDGTGWTTSELLPLLPDTSKLSREWLACYLRSRSFVSKAVASTAGSKMPRVNRKVVLDAEIPLPILNEQEHAIAQFTAIDQARESASRQLSLLDDLVKSRFIKMFGDPRKNTKGWPEKPLGEVGTTRLGKMLDAKKQTGEHKRPYLANTDVQWFKFNLDDLRTMDFDEGDRAEYALREGDLLVTEGGEVGRCAVWHCALEECYFQKAVHRIRCKRDVLIPDYLAWTFKMKSENALFEPFVSRSTIAHLTGKKIREVPIQLPPLPLQQEFADFVAKVDKSRLLVQKQIDKLQTLYDSLAQDYFG